MKAILRPFTSGLWVALVCSWLGAAVLIEVVSTPPASMRPHASGKAVRKLAAAVVRQVSMKGMGAGAEAPKQGLSERSTKLIEGGISVLTFFAAAACAHTPTAIYVLPLRWSSMPCYHCGATLRRQLQQHATQQCLQVNPLPSSDHSFDLHRRYCKPGLIPCPLQRAWRDPVPPRSLVD